MTANQEIMLVDISNLQAGVSGTELKLNDDLARVEEELDRYTNKASKEDYALAVASGLLAGIVDALYVGETPMFGVGTEDARAGVNHQVNDFIEKYANARGIERRNLSGHIAGLEDRFKVAQDNVWKGEGIGVSAKNHHLADLAHHPTPLGFAAAVIVQFLRVGLFVNRDGKWHVCAVKTTQEDILRVLVPAILTGFLNWVASMSEEVYEECSGEKVPDAIRKLARLASAAPMLIEIAKCADNWFGHLVSDMGGSKNTASKGMGIPGVFLSMAYEFAALPGLKETRLLSVLDKMYTKQKFDMRHELVAVEALGKQAIPVLLNEAIVRMGFFISRFAHALCYGTRLTDLDWAEIVPIGNRTVDRMMTVASMTLSLADTADAAVHACLESAGNWVLFSQRFVTRFNYVAAGRATLAVVREVIDDAKEAELLRERRLLVEARSALVVERLEEYMAQLSERVDAYIAEDLQTFFEGFAMMDQGLASGDSDLVIRGNVTIQRVLGREPQFTNQEEFDDLMGSDDDFIL